MIGPARRRRGITFVELMVVVMIMGLIAAGISRVLTSSWQSEAAIRGQNLVQKAAQQAADEVMDGLRGASEIVSGGATEVVAAFPNENTVRYYLDGGALKCDRYTKSTNTTTTETICDRVSALSFAYFVRVGSGLAPASTAVLAQAVRVSVTVSSGLDRATESSLVKLRNKQ